MHPTIASWVRYLKEIALANQITLFSEFLAHNVMPKNGKRMSPWKECVWSANRLFFMPKYFFFKKPAQNLEIIVVDSPDWHTYVLHIWSKSSDPLKSRKKMCVFFKIYNTEGSKVHQVVLVVVKKFYPKFHDFVELCQNLL